MARIDYSDAVAEAFHASRELPPGALSEWRAAIARHLAPRPGMRVLDLGAGTGTWAATLASWYGISVVAVEPSAAMLARSRWPAMIAGHATGLPLASATMDGAWLSTVVHHLPDLPAAARELRRVLWPGAPVLIRSAFPGRHHGIGLFRYWPEAIAALDTFPSVTSVRTAFAAEGFSYVTLQPVRQVTAPSLAAIAATAQREAHTPLMLITDDAYKAGLARLRAAAATQPGPVTDTLDLLVLQADHATATAPPTGQPGRRPKRRMTNTLGSLNRLAPVSGRADRLLADATSLIAATGRSSRGQHCIDVQSSRPCVWATTGPPATRGPRVHRAPTRLIAGRPSSVV